MRHIPLFLTLLLMWAWVYTSWYWYTCNIKWFCDYNAVYTDSQKDVPSSESYEQNTQEEVFIDAENPKDDMPDVQTIEDEIDTSLNFANSGALSAEDVLRDSPKKEISASWAENTLSWATNTPEEIEKKTDDKILTLCQKPLLWPIKLWAKNDESEVKRLEQFLVSQWEELTVDGVYRNDDFEAVKRFQVKYRAQILDPWSIKNPTGYVFRTTVKTMNEVACWKTYTSQKTENTSEKMQEDTKNTSEKKIEEDVFSDESSL